MLPYYSYHYIFALTFLVVFLNSLTRCCFFIRQNFVLYTHRILSDKLHVFPTPQKRKKPQQGFVGNRNGIYICQCLHVNRYSDNRIKSKWSEQWGRPINYNQLKMFDLIIEPSKKENKRNIKEDALGRIFALSYTGAQQNGGWSQTCLCSCQPH